MTLLSVELDDSTLSDDEPQWRVLYKAVPSTKNAITEDGEIVVGLVMECISEPGPHDIVDDMKQNLSNYSFIFQLKDDPVIKAGDIFVPRITNRSTDWESGIIDDWDVAFAQTTIREDDKIQNNYK